MTAFVLSGQSLGLIGQDCRLARVLQPSMIILEDIDLIGGDRTFGPVGSNPLLFEVLNQIDSLGDDGSLARYPEPTWEDFERAHAITQQQHQMRTGQTCATGSSCTWIGR